MADRGYALFAPTARNAYGIRWIVTNKRNYCLKENDFFSRLAYHSGEFFLAIVFLSCYRYRQPAQSTGIDHRHVCVPACLHSQNILHSCSPTGAEAWKLLRQAWLQGRHICPDAGWPICTLAVNMPFTFISISGLRGVSFSVHRWASCSFMLSEIHQGARLCTFSAIVHAQGDAISRVAERDSVLYKPETEPLILG